MPLSYLNPRHARGLRSLLALVAGAAVVAPFAAPAVAGPAVPAAGPRSSAAPTSCGQLFDDFRYTSSSDPALRARGWSVRAGGGGPGVSGNSWSASNVDFPGSGEATTMRLRASTDGTAAGTVNAEVSHERKFFEGTYAARVRFTDAPTTGADGDPVNETFFTITPLDRPNDPSYGENDFEYLPNGGWGESGATLFTTTYETYQPDPWVADNLSTPVRGSLAGWHDLVMQVADGSVRYYVDGTQVAEHGGHVYPETPMILDFNIWFIDLDSHTGGVSRYEQEVDYVYYTDREVLAPADVTSRVAAFRSTGVAHRDDVTAGTCTSSPVPTPVATATPPTPTPGATATSSPRPTSTPTSAPTPSPTPTVAPEPAGVDCDGLSAWSRSSWYRKGATVTADGHAWKAKRLTWRSEPGSSRRWTDLGACSV